MVQTVGGRRSNRRQTEKQSRERKSRAGGSAWKYRLKIPETPIKVHFQRPEEPYPDPTDPEIAYPWYKGAKHYIPSIKKYIQCNYAECLTCAHRRPKEFGFNDVTPAPFLKDCHPKAFYSVTAVVEEWHRVLQLESGKKDEKTGEKLTFPARVAEVELKDYNLSIKDVKEDPRVYGRKAIFDISAPAWNNDFNEVFEQVERFTRDGGYLIPVAYVCSNPECGQDLFDMTQVCPNCESNEIGIDSDEHIAQCEECDFQWTLLEYRDKELKKQVLRELECPTCGNRDFPQIKLSKLNLESGEVTEEVPEGGWDAYDIFDVQFVLRTQRAKDDSPPRIVIDSWKIQPIDQRLFDPKLQGDGEDGEKYVERNKKPFDLSKMHGRDVPAVQAKILDLPNLFSANAGRGGGRSARRYVRPDRSK